MARSDFRRERGFQDTETSDPLNRRSPLEILKARPPLTAPQRQMLWRWVKGAPQAVLVVPPPLKTGPQLTSHLKYITRSGHEPLRDESGLDLKGEASLKELSQDWACVDGLDSRRRSNSPLARRFVFSGPTGAPASAVERATVHLLARAIGAERPYVHVTHTDTDHPHVHAVVRCLGSQRRRLAPSITDMERLRERFAEALREEGVEADASPRWVRGLAGRGPLASHWRLQHEFETLDGPAPHWMRTQSLEAAKLAFSGVPPDANRELKILASQGSIRRSFLDLAQRLTESPEVEDRRLASAIEVFVRRMPPPETERLQLARRLKAAHSRSRKQYERAEPTRER